MPSTSRAYRRGDTITAATDMAKAIRCVCGFTGRGATAELAADAIEAHLRAEHPELAGRIRREDLLAMAEEA